MDATPKRRWLRFRLSTVLMLTATAAWTMALKPWLEVNYQRLNPATPEWESTMRLGKGVTNGWFVAFGASLHSDGIPSEYDWELTIHFGPKPGLLGPALALVVFLGGKRAYAAIARRRERTPTHS